MRSHTFTPKNENAQGSDFFPLFRVTQRARSPDSHDDATFGAPLENLKKEFDDVDVSLEKMRTIGTVYYREFRFKVYASPARGREIELVDGGNTNWTQKLLNNAKELLVISGIGSERLCEKFAPTRKSLP